MTAATFQIVTTDNKTHTQGRAQTGTFTDLGAPEGGPRLESFALNEGYLVLRYTGGFSTRIPESHIAYIAEYDPSA